MFDGLVARGEVGGYELIFVNDASTDRSEAILRAEARRRGDIRLINMSRNFGVSPCVLAGMQHASGDAVIYMDADLQDPPELIPELIRKWKDDPEVDVVHTVRHVRLGESRIKRLLTRIGYATLRTVSSIDLPHEAGDFKLLSRRAVDQVVQYREKRPFMRGLVCSIGFKQERVYYDRQPRASGETKFPVLGWKVIRNFLDSAVISFSDVPLKLAGGLGLLFTFVGCCWIAALLTQGWLGHAVPGWSAGSGRRRVRWAACNCCASAYWAATSAASTSRPRGGPISSSRTHSVSTGMEAITKTFVVPPSGGSGRRKPVLQTFIRVGEYSRPEHSVCTGRRALDRRDVKLVALVSGVMGLFLGIASGWQVALESARWSPGSCNTLAIIPSRCITSRPGRSCTRFRRRCWPSACRNACWPWPLADSRG